jgi:transcriptional regulator with XRE-family HTH domain
MEHQRLAAAVRAQRNALGLTQQDVATRANIGARDTVAKVEHGFTVRSRTLWLMDRALEWPPGTCQAILDGAEPPPLPHWNDPAVPLYDADERAIWALTKLDVPTRVALLELKRQRVAAAARAEGENIA